MAVNVANQIARFMKHYSTTIQYALFSRRDGAWKRKLGRKYRSQVNETAEMFQTSDSEESGSGESSGEFSPSTLEDANLLKASIAPDLLLESGENTRQNGVVKKSGLCLLGCSFFKLLLCNVAIRFV